MIVISDTSPLTALLTIGAGDILTNLFTEVVIPEAVRNELLRSHPHLPPWLRVEAVKNPAQVRQYAQIVDLGEAEAIDLAKELQADRLLIDERKGRRLAMEKGIPIIGLLGVVLLARRNQIIPSARALLQRLDSEAGMYLAEDIKEAALKSVGE
jgi:predicted nucleic acid-binding protein